MSRVRDEIESEINSGFQNEKRKSDYEEKGHEDTAFNWLMASH